VLADITNFIYGVDGLTLTPSVVSIIAFACPDSAGTNNDLVNVNVDVLCK
jgi:UDP-N-acetylmuramyl pentapeptide phosphotransferase/UDP-N-acetylglucosamine-1-phosphate transferase